MPDDTKSPDNFDRLLTHLKDGSLAARLVQTHRTPDTDNPAESMRDLLKERLKQVRNDLADTEA